MQGFVRDGTGTSVATVFTDAYSGGAHENVNVEMYSTQCVKRTRQTEKNTVLPQLTSTSKCVLALPVR